MDESVRLVHRGLTNVYYCQARCSYLFDAETGQELMPPGVVELNIGEAADLVRRSRRAQSPAVNPEAEAPAAQSFDPLAPYFEDYAAWRTDD